MNLTKRNKSYAYIPTKSYDGVCLDGLRVKKTVDGRNIEKKAAVPDSFSEGSSFEITLCIPRRSGLCGVRLAIARDGEESFYYDFTLSSDCVTDTFNLSVPTRELAGGLENGLYYYHLELSFGNVTVYTEYKNNVDAEFSKDYPNFRRRLLVYDKNFDTPDWFCGNIMYHIFVDRFFKGSVEVEKNELAVINTDWENGVPQYGEYPGAFVTNNMFFGGTLFGVAQKLDYLQSLGVGCIYLSPIFKAYSNHKYDTGDYMTVDEMFGGEAALKNLIEKAATRGIKIILDGVFNHTGDDSIYFNRYGRYNSIGAYQSIKSPYRDWYFFEDSGYKSWWGIEILPKLNLENKKCSEYFLGKDGVIEKYMDMGIGGIRLDVADELPDEFLDGLRRTVYKKNPTGLIIGEVWENAVDKVSYGKRRRYFRGSQLDSVMNYPFRNAAIRFVKNGDAEFFYNILTELYSCYPKNCSDVLMNILGTHDTERVLTELGGDASDGLTNRELSTKRMTKKQREKAIKMLKVASVLQYTVFGTPSVFYGDEAGLEGYHDPFCRMPFPWSKINTELYEHYRQLGEIRRSENVFKKGVFEFCSADNGFVAYKRCDGECEIIVLANAGKEKKIYQLCGEYTNLMSKKNFKDRISVSPMSAVILKKIKE